MRHVFTQEQRKLGGQNRQKLPDAQAHQEEAFEMLKAKRPDCWRWIYNHRVAPHMQARGVSKQAVERAAMQQGQLEQHIGKRRSMK